jgi:hypothetical protein
MRLSLSKDRLDVLARTALVKPIEAICCPYLYRGKVAITDFVDRLMDSKLLSLDGIFGGRPYLYRGKVARM